MNPDLRTRVLFCVEPLFLAGNLTDEPELVEAAINQFDSVWAGFKCKDCGRREYCGDPIMKL